MGHSLRKSQPPPSIPVHPFTLRKSLEKNDEAINTTEAATPPGSSRRSKRALTRGSTHKLTRTVDPDRRTGDPGNGPDEASPGPQRKLKGRQTRPLGFAIENKQRAIRASPAPPETPPGPAPRTPRAPGPTGRRRRIDGFRHEPPLLHRSQTGWGSRHEARPLAGAHATPHRFQEIRAPWLSSQDTARSRHAPRPPRCGTQRPGPPDHAGHRWFRFSSSGVTTRFPVTPEAFPVVSPAPPEATEPTELCGRGQVVGPFPCGSHAPRQSIRRPRRSREPGSPVPTSSVRRRCTQSLMRMPLRTFRR